MNSFLSSFLLFLIIAQQLLITIFFVFEKFSKNQKITNVKNISKALPFTVHVNNRMFLKNVTGKRI